MLRRGYDSGFRVALDLKVIDKRKRGWSKKQAEGETKKITLKTENTLNRAMWLIRVQRVTEGVG